jgi:hypothetical protein
MTLSYRCSNCGTELQTTNADALEEMVDPTFEQIEEACRARIHSWEYLLDHEQEKYRVQAVDWFHAWNEVLKQGEEE